MAAFNMSSMIRWLDFNDTWLGEEWGHPSDCIGALLSCCYYANTCFILFACKRDCDLGLPFIFWFNMTVLLVSACLLD